MAIKYFTKQYAGILPNLFETKAPFLRVFGGALQVKADAEYNENFMDLKITDTDVTIQAYSTDAATASVLAQETQTALAHVKKLNLLTQLLNGKRHLLSMKVSTNSL